MTIDQIIEYVMTHLNCFNVTLFTQFVEEAMEPVPPTPTGLTAFEVGQTLVGYDFGDVTLGARDTELEAFLNSLPTTSYALVSDSKDAIINTYHGPHPWGGEGDVVFIAVVANTQPTELNPKAKFVYSSAAVQDVCTEGWQNLVDGKCMLLEGQSLTVASVSSVTGWNGTIVGAIEGEAPVPPTPTLTPFHTTDSVDTGDFIVFDRSKGSADGSSCELLTFLQSLETAGEGGASLYQQTQYAPFPMCMVVGSNDSMLLCAFRFTEDNNNYYALLGFGSSSLTWFLKGWSQKAVDLSTYGLSNIELGWSQSIPQDGRCEMNMSFGQTNSLLDVEGWNGVFVGLEKASTSLIPFQVGNLIYGYAFNSGELYTRDENFEAVLNAICDKKGDGGMVTLIQVVDHSALTGQLIQIGRNGDIVLCAVVNSLSESSGGPVVIYSSAAMPGMVEQAGWQVASPVINLDYARSTVEAIYYGEDWNGVIIGNLASAPEVPSYNISVSVTNGSYSGGVSTLSRASSTTFTFTAEAGYHLPNYVSIAHCQSNWNAATGELEIAYPNDNVTIEIICQQDSPTLTFYVNTVPYTCESGTNWNTFAKAHSGDGFAIDPEKSFITLNGSEVLDGGATVYDTDLIVANIYYYTK